MNSIYTIKRLSISDVENGIMKMFNSVDILVGLPQETKEQLTNIAISFSLGRDPNENYSFSEIVQK